MAQIIAEELGMLCEDLRKGLINNKPLNEQDGRDLVSNTRRLTADHLEIQYGDYWKRQNLAFKEQIVKETVKWLLDLIKNQKQPIDIYLQINAPVKIEEVFTRLFNQIKKTQPLQPPPAAK
jgi:hypothetical protein